MSESTAPRLKEVSFYIDQMTCQACSSGIERALNRKDFCHSIQVHLLSKKAILIFDENKINIEKIFAFIRKMGYAPYFDPSKSMDSHTPDSVDSINPINPSHSTIATKSTPSSNILITLDTLIESFNKKYLPPKRKVLIASILSVIVLFISWADIFGLSLPRATSITSMLFLSLIVMHMGRLIYFRGLKALIHANPTMESLIAIGSGSAFIYSLWGIFNPSTHLYFDSVCVIISLVLLGKMLESKSKQEALDSASMLLSLNQKSIHKVLLDSQNSSMLNTKNLENTQTADVRADSIQPQDILKILPGEMVLVDCIVIYGNSSIDCTAINGESLPVIKKQNDEILSGSINLEQTIFAKVLKPSSESTLAQILKLAQKAQESKAHIATLADKISAFFVPVVIILALIAGVVWWILRDFGFGLEIFIATLVISCPCALGLATPMAIFYAQSISHKMGVLFKNASCLEHLASITHIAFDKTGTLTQGLEITQILSLSPQLNEQDIFAFSYALESHSTHIITEAFQRSTYSQHIYSTQLTATNVQNIIGYGLKGEIMGTTYMLGNADLLTESLKTLAQNLAKNDKITLYLATSDQILGVIYLQDSIKTDAKDTLEYFRTKGFDFSLISGDTFQNAQKVAQDLGIPNITAHAKPEDKIQALKALAEKEEKVLMVGDGINDTPALAYAHTSMAFSSPNDIATNTAQIVIYNNRLLSIYNAWRLSQATLRNIRQNLYFAFCYNIAFIPTAMGVFGGFGIFLHPMFCALAMTCSSLSVILNAGRLKKFQIL